MLIQETTTQIPAAEVKERARAFFMGRFSPYAAYVSDESDGHIRFRTEVAELTIGIVPRENGALVRGSTTRMHHQLSQFLTTLNRPEEVRQSLLGPGAAGAG